MATFLRKLVYKSSVPILRILQILSVRHFMRVYLTLLSFVGLRILGVPRFISPKTRFDNFNIITLGDRVVISDDVIFLTHDYSLTTALRAIDQAPSTDWAFSKGITIGDNVFIGMRAVILPGVSVGKNSIVGAGSVVRRDVPDNSVVMGNPSVVVGNVFDLGYKWRQKLLHVELIKDVR